MTKPATMRAVRLDQVGPPENLKIVDIPVPTIDEHGVLIKTALAGMLYSDVEARKGTYYTKTKLPWFPGREVAGTVEAVGAEVTQVKPGDRVVALVLSGACYAEYVAASTRSYTFPGGTVTTASDIIVLPGTVSFEQSLMYLVNFRLAHLLIHAWAKVPPGARILVHGAGGGMGSMVIQQARALGCIIIALVRSDEEADFCRRIGADHAVNTTKAKYEEAVLDLTDGKGVAFSFNGVGGDTVNRDPAVVAPFGEIHLYGYVAGKTDFHPFVHSRSIALKTFSADDFFATPHFAAATAALHDWFRSGPLIEVGKIFRLDEAATAHRWLEAGRVIGKIALRP